MGIPGLLPNFKSISNNVHIRHYKGKRVAIDTYGWLHRGAFTCSKELCQDLPTEKYITYCMHRVNLLRHHGVTPVLVFDGGALPAKAQEEAKRARSRKEKLAHALAHEKAGNSSAAYKCYQEAVDITPLLAFRLIQVLQKENVEYIVAPYEADAQMAFLALSGHVDAVITEDSDLIAYGCPRVLFKMDKFGQGVEIQYSDIARTKELNFANFTKQMMLEMCVLSGCDYLPSLQGMGVKRAHVLIRRFKNYKKVLGMLKFDGVAIPERYEESFAMALLAFQHQRVFDPSRGRLVHLTELPSDLDMPSCLDFIGPDLPPDIASAIARGECDPVTHKPFQSSCPGEVPDVLPTRPHRQRRKEIKLPCQRNVISNYFFSTSSAAKREFRPPRAPINFEEEVVGLREELSQDICTTTTGTPDLSDDLYFSPPDCSLHLSPNREVNTDSTDFDSVSLESPDFDLDEPAPTIKRVRVDVEEDKRCWASPSLSDGNRQRHLASSSTRQENSGGVDFGREPDTGRRMTLPAVGHDKRSQETSRRKIAVVGNTRDSLRHTSGPAVRKSSSFFQKPCNSEDAGGAGGASNFERLVPEYATEEAGPSRSRGLAPGMQERQHNGNTAAQGAGVVDMDSEDCNDEEPCILRGGFGSDVSHATRYAHIGKHAFGILARTLDRYSHSSGGLGATRMQRPPMVRLQSALNKKPSGNSSSIRSPSFEDFAFKPKGQF